jgi:polygalacturonase
MRRVLLSNITSSGASPLPSIISGVPGQMIEDVKLSDVIFEQAGGGSAEMASIQPPENEAKYPDPHMFGDLPATGLFARHIRNLEVNNVEIAVKAADARPAFWLHDVEGADFFRVRVPRSSPAFDLRDVKDFRSFGSRRLADVTLDQVESRKI